MSSAKDVVLGQLQSGDFLIEKFTADLSDTEYFAPPTEGANHAGWILGHIATSEDWAVSKIVGCEKRILESLHDRFRGGAPCVPDASKYPSRKEIDELFRNTRAATIEALQTSDEGTWDDPSPEGLPRELFPTIGSAWGMQGTHQFWHIGQLAVCRTALKKKPVLF